VDKLERLMNLTMTLLQTPRPLTAAEIRERIPGYPDNDPAFRRAFERDKESLREMGVPISIEPLTHSDPPADGYRIHEADYYLRDPGFEPDELAALHLAASAVRLDTAHGIEGLWKLGGAGEAPDTGAGEPLAALPGDPNLGPLFTAVAERRSIGLRYHDRDRTIDPYRLDFQRGRWYLTGYDRDRADERNFRVDRIEGPVRLGDPRSFERPETGVRGGAAQPWQFGEGDPVTAHLLVDADQAGWVRQHLGADAVVEERTDGSVVFRASVTTWPAFRSFVLTFLEHAEILSPPDLRARMVEFLEAQR
jgi:predicted DNA-binding transcriptional regulator YafY